MMYGCVVSMIAVLVTVTTARDGLQSSVGELEAVKDANGVRQCATSPPNTTVTARSKIDCMRVSLGNGCSYGANYHSDSRTCEMYYDIPDSMGQVPNCVYYQVCNWSLNNAN